MRRTQVEKRDWAHEIDVNKAMPNFHELVPDMAHKVSLIESFDRHAPSLFIPVAVSF